MCKHGVLYSSTGKEEPTRRQVFDVDELQNQRTARDDAAPARKEVSPDDVLQHGTLSAGLPAHDRDLREVDCVAPYSVIQFENSAPTMEKTSCMSLMMEISPCIPKSLLFRSIVWL